MIAPLALVLLFAQPEPPVSLRELNARGISAFRQKKLEEAAKSFDAAVRAAPVDPPLTLKTEVERSRQLAFAHYNLACALSLLRQAGRLCTVENYRSNIIHHLHQAVRLEPSRLERALKDPDLRAVRDTLGFQSLLGLSPRELKDLSKLLTKVRWFAPGKGAAGSLEEYRFFARGTVEALKQRFDDEGKRLPPLRVRGTWTLDGRQLRLVWPGGAVNEGSFVENGQLVFDGQRWSDEPTECDA